MSCSPRLACADLLEAQGGGGALPPEIAPIGPRMRLWGEAWTVACPPGDNLWLHRAAARAPRGAVLVVAPTGPPAPGTKSHGAYGYWGELLTEAALLRGVAGLLIDGHVRDGEAIERAGFPVFARGLCLRGTAKDLRAPGELGGTVRIGDVAIASGDLIAGDGDGAVAVAAAEVATVLRRAAERSVEEVRLRAAIRAGATTLELFGLVDGSEGAQAHPRPRRPPLR